MLRYITSTLTACALAGVVGVFAQEQKPTPPQQEQETPAPEKLTGCVQEAKTTDGGTAYVLREVEGGTAPMYVLIGPPPAELASHVDHKVEVTGQIQQPSPPPADDGATGEPKVLRPPLVQVESVRMVADNCE